MNLNLRYQSITNKKQTLMTSDWNRTKGECTQSLIKRESNTLCVHVFAEVLGGGGRLLPLPRRMSHEGRTPNRNVESAYT